MENIPQGPICQSCGMPMQKDEDFGKEADGSKNEMYCTYCYQHGVFTQPDLTKEQQIEQVSKIATKEMGMPEEQAKEMAQKTIPTLKRWQ